MLVTGFVPILILFTGLLSIAFEAVNAVHGHHYIRKSVQQRQKEDAEMEDELDEEEDDGVTDRLLRMGGAPALEPWHGDGGRTAGKPGTSHHDSNKDTFFVEQGEYIRETHDFLQFLRRIHYDHRQTPPQIGAEEPVQISVSLVVSNVRAVSEVTMDYSLEMFYREIWRDTRLRYDMALFKNKTELSLHESYANFLWHPDTFMPNAIASKNPRKQSISHRSLLRLQSDGQILYSRRLSVVAECPMDLTLFPFDSQTCKLGIESYGYTSDQVRYGWSHGEREALKLHKIRLPDFRIKEAFVTSQLESYATGNYSRLYVCFVFSRSAGFCFLQLIIPSTAVVITSWVSLWMENETSFQDMISIILTITFLLFSYNEVMPRVSYLKALDIWLAVCFMIVFLSLIKLALMKYMRQRLKLVANPQNCAGIAGMLPTVAQMAATSNGMVSLGVGAPPGAGGGSFCCSHSPSVISFQPRPPTPPQQLRVGSKRRSAGGHGGSSSGSSSRRETARQQRAGSEENARTNTVGTGLGMALGGAVTQMLAHQAMNHRNSQGSGNVPYAPPISTLASLNLPLTQSSMRQLHQQYMYQAQQQLYVQAQIQQAQLLHHAQRTLREKERRRKEKQKQRKRGKKMCRQTVVDVNGNERARENSRFLRTSPSGAIRIGIESSSSSSASSSGDESECDARAKPEKERRLFFCFDEFGNVEFSPQFMRRFHWISQMTFFFGFVIFCLFFFLVYPNSRSAIVDPACVRSSAEWFASIPV